MVRRTEGLPFSWKVRKGFWNTFLALKYKGAKPAYMPVPVQQDRKIKPIPLADFYPSIPIRNVLVADHIPADEAQPGKRKAVAFQVWLSDHYPQMQAGLPPAADDPRQRLLQAYSGGRSKLFPPPVIPDVLKMTDSAAMLGRLAVEGPFSGYLQKAGNHFEWDLAYLDDPAYPLHPGLEKIGARVRFKVDRSNRSLKAGRIDTAAGSFSPGDSGWEAAVKTALCAVSNEISIVRHFTWVHLAAGSMFAIATRNQFRADHPMRRLLWPHMFRSQYSNDMITEIQLGDTGDLANMFSFTADGVHALIDVSYQRYRIETAHPKLNAARRGITGAGFDTPSQDNLEQLYDVFLRHTTRYVESYYEDDAAVAGDGQVNAWLAEMDRLIPNGTGAVTNGMGSRQALAELCATMIYVGSVQHEVLGTNLWNYQLWTHIIPCRIYTNGQNEPVDVYQRLLNANLNLNIYRAQIMRDFGYLAVDARGKELFDAFLADLTALNDDMRKQPILPWKIYPDILEANMNA